MKKRMKNQQGAAMIIVAVVLIVIMMLSLSLLLITYSLYHTAASSQTMEECKEMALTLSEQLQDEITISYDNYAAQLEDAKMIVCPHPIWFYLRYNALQSSWKYYNPDEFGHGVTSAYRYFTLGDQSGNKQYPGNMDDIKILMYCESESDSGANDELVVKVTCSKSGQTASITTRYVLSVDNYKDENLQSGEDATVSASFNPNHNTIQFKDKWQWFFSMRE